MRLPTYDPDRPCLCETCKHGQPGIDYPECEFLNPQYLICEGCSQDGTDAVFVAGPFSIVLVYRRLPERPEYTVWRCSYYEKSSRANYREYLKSPEWRQKRTQKLRAADYRCERCGSAINLSIHHVSYDHLGHEPFDDLVCLCRTCHAEIHGKEAAP